MNNYQLYRTNVLLGGQMKYDLILNSSGNNVDIIDDIHISPISDRAPYNKYIKDDILNYSHQENIKNFYKNMSGSFYKDFITPVLNNPYPLPDNYNEDNYESTYEMGCRRKNYQLYSKQFEFFCPVWIEQLSDLSKIKFEIRIKTTLEQSAEQPLLISKIIKFNDKIEKYFNDYIKFVKIDSGKDWILDINKLCSIVSGLNVESGTNTNVELNHFYKDLIYRERPLLEFNNMIINELNKNKLIAPQLFNFNICFNLDDLLSDFVMMNLYCQPVYIDINVLINDEALCKKDIFSNYEHIKKKVLSVDTYSQTIYRNNELEKFTIQNIDLVDFNVLDYLKDNKCIDLIDKNKILQNVCHWCNSADPSYHFNIYDGFSLLFKKQSEYIEIPYYSENIADLNSSTIDVEKYQYPYWCNCYNLSKNDSEQLINEILNQFYNHDYLFSTFSSNCVVKNINYKTLKDIKPINVVMLEINHPIDSEPSEQYWQNWDFFKNFKDNYNGSDWIYIEIGEGIDTIKLLYNEIIREVILVVYKYDKHTYKTKLIYKNILPILSESDVQILSELYDILSSPNLSGLDIIKFSNGLVHNRANSPSISSQEIEYYKAKSNKSVARLMGKIKPYFISEDDVYKNYQYYKLKYDETPIEYKMYSQSIYEPKYPSLNYTALEYTDVLYTYDTNHEYLKTKLESCLESHHYTVNKIMHLLSYIEYERVISDNNLHIEDLVKDCIREKYQILFNSSNNEEESNKMLTYIVNKYELTKSYIEMDNNKYVYKIQIRLK